MTVDSSIRVGNYGDSVASLNRPAPAAAALGSVTSKDGTTISYRRVGRGPALVLLHGTMVAARDFTQLADALSDTFTVYTPDRRGRGASGPYRDDHTMARETEDLAALCSRTGARYVFGVSLGGLIVLQAALSGQEFDEIAVYEPALLPDGASWIHQVERYDREMAQGKAADALVTSLKVTKIGGPMLDILPRSLLISMTRKAMMSEDAHAQPGEVTMRGLAPTFHYDARLILELAGTAENLRGVDIPVLLLGGTKSPRWLKSALDTAAGFLPHVERVVFPGLNHGGATNANMMNRTGNPGLVAQEAKRFFA